MGGKPGKTLVSADTYRNNYPNAPHRDLLDRYITCYKGIREKIESLLPKCEGVQELILDYSKAF